MPLLDIVPVGIDGLRLRLLAARALLPELVGDAMAEIGADATAQLAAAAPIGRDSGQDPPAGDAPGALAESFGVELDLALVAARLVVRTSQPGKLRMVRYGTGTYGPAGQRITPRSRRALAWPTATHPIASSAGQRPNDFVTPALEEARAAAEARLAAVGQEFLDALRTL